MKDLRKLLLKTPLPVGLFLKLWVIVPNLKKKEQVQLATWLKEYEEKKSILKKEYNKRSTELNKRYLKNFQLLQRNLDKDRENLIIKKESAEADKLLQYL
ncbi:hypothetical protein K9M41_02680 [Candidatus Gracilibacteria bacterium]|nr:hypothetical protein [Candidatus Gracilibacteria bacterium]